MKKLALLKLTPIQAISLDRLLKGKFSAQQLLDVLAHGDAPLWHALHPTLHAIATAHVMQLHQQAVDAAQARAVLLYPDDLKVRDEKNKIVRKTREEMASIIEGFRARYTAGQVSASPTALCMHAPVLDRISVMKLARDHSETAGIAADLRELLGGGEAVERFMMSEVHRITSELRAGGGDRSLMYLDKINRRYHPDEQAICRHVADELHPEFEVKAATLRDWMQRPKSRHRTAS